MALDLMHAGRPQRGGAGGDGHLGRQRQHRPGGARLPGAGPRGTRASTAPNLVKPETGHPAFDKACHLFGVEMRRARDRPGDDAGPAGDRRGADRRETRSRSSARPATTATARSTRSPSLGGWRSSAGWGCTSTAASAATCCRSASSSACRSRPSTSGCPGVTTISADTHKYGYGLKGTSTLLFRDRELRNRCYFFMPDWSGGKYFSPGIEGSRSDGLLAATWASLVSIGREGYRTYAKRIFETAAAMQEAVRSHPELRHHGRADLPLRLHLGRVRHLPRQRRDEAARLAPQRAPVPERPPHGGDPAADPAGGGGGVRRRISTPRSPTRASTATSRPSRAPSTAGSRAASTPTPRR